MRLWMDVQVRSGRVVRAPLEREELMYRTKRSRIRGRDAKRRAAWQLGDAISDELSFRRHGPGARHCGKVDERGRAKITALEGMSDFAQVPAYHLGASGIVTVTLQLDSASIWQVVKAVDGRILVHTHRGRTSLLHRSKARVLRVNQP